MSVDTKDILLKAAEDVTQGMWCRLHWFRDVYHVVPTVDSLFGGEIAIEDAQASRRCAQGSLALASALLGGDQDDYDGAIRAVHSHLLGQGQIYGLIALNDRHLPDDPFAAGQQLATLFRETAASL